MGIKKKRYATSSVRSISIRATFSSYSRPPSVTTFSAATPTKKPCWIACWLIRPNDADTKVTRAFVELDWKADTRPLHQLIDEIRAKESWRNPKCRRWLA